MVTIKNKTKLVEGTENPLTQKARQLALDCLEYAVNAVDPKKIITQKLSYKGDVLIASDRVFDLAKFHNVYVVGGGKAAGAMAEALGRKVPASKYSPDISLHPVFGDQDAKKQHYVECLLGPNVPVGLNST